MLEAKLVARPLGLDKRRRAGRVLVHGAGHRRPLEEVAHVELLLHGSGEVRCAAAI